MPTLTQQMKEEFKEEFMQILGSQLKNEGKREGKKEGMEEKAIETAKKMLKKGFETDIGAFIVTAIQARPLACPHNRDMDMAGAHGLVFSMGHIGLVDLQVLRTGPVANRSEGLAGRRSH